MNITSYSREQIAQGLQNAREKHEGMNDNIRIIFAPEVINDRNFEQACNIYSRLDMANYDTVVVVESHNEKLDKKLPMASNDYFETPLGKVRVNDYMRNELCDEEDDFFIHDEAFGNDISLFQQLMFLQTLNGDFEALSIQIADQAPAIVRELGYVLEEVLASKNALIVFCCELDSTRKKEFKNIVEMVHEKNESGLMNYLNSGESHIKGTTAFIGGIIVANKWGSDLHFLHQESDKYSGNLLTAYADRRQRVAV